MTDREMLELAAKAAGLFHWDGSYGLVNEYGMPWDPLNDNGDAFELAVKLKLEICIWEWDTTVLTSDENIPTLGEIHAGDPLAATRRAIVRAAAEIGKRMA